MFLSTKKLWSRLLSRHTSIRRRSAEHSLPVASSVERMEPRQVMSANNLLIAFNADGTLTKPFTTESKSAVQAATSERVYYVSLSDPGQVTGSDSRVVKYDDSDIVEVTFDAAGAAKFRTYFDGSDVGLDPKNATEDIDAFDILADGSIVISTVGKATVGNLTITGSDLVRFTPTQLGENTAGSWRWFLDGSDVGLTEPSENIDSVGVLSDGSLMISTSGNAQVSGLKGPQQDLLRFKPDQLGAQSRGAWSRFLDGSDIGLKNAKEDIDAVAISGDSLILSTQGKGGVSGLKFGPADLLRFTPQALGADTSGKFTLELSAAGVFPKGANVDGLHVGRANEPKPLPATSEFNIDVRFVDNSLTPTQKAAFSNAAARWSQIIVGDLPDVVYNGMKIDDVRIEAKGLAIDGSGGILGQAGPTLVRAVSLLPAQGVMQFDTADLVMLERDGQLEAVILHEMGHVLGIGTLWERMGLTQNAKNEIRYVGQNAVTQFNTIFQTSGKFAPVETDGGPGTAGGHWDEAVFGNELMSGYLNAATNPLSRITVGSLADMGYQVILDKADNYQPPAGMNALQLDSFGDQDDLSADSTTPAHILTAMVQTGPTHASESPVTKSLTSAAESVQPGGPTALHSKLPHHEIDELMAHFDKLQV